MTINGVFFCSVKHFFVVVDNRIVGKGVAPEDERPIECTLCNMTFKRRMHGENHLESVHFPGNYVCRFCDGVVVKTTKMMFDKHVRENHKDLLRTPQVPRN